MAYWRDALTLTQARTRVLQRCDMEGSGFVSTDELDYFINNAIGEEHALLAATHQDILRDNQDVAVVASTREYTLSEPIYQLISAKLVIDSYEFPLCPFEDDQITTSEVYSWGYYYTPRYQLRFDPSTACAHKIKFDPPSDAAQTIKVEYIPAPRTYATASEPIQMAFPDYYVLGAAIACLDKEKTDASHLRNERDRIEQRIKAHTGPIDRQPRGINDQRSLEDYD